MAGLGDPVRVRSRWRRRRIRRELQDGVDELAARADHDVATVWRVQPVIEVCAAQHYPEWRQAREKTWRREHTTFHTRTWPQRLMPAEIAGVLLPQMHGGHYRGQAAEIALPVFSHGPPPSASADFEHPYEPLMLVLTAGWVRMVRAAPDAERGVLLAPPLVDVIAPHPGARIPRELGITWPLAVSQPHVRPRRRRA